jgi:catechol 2,3-dioxygenase-like lactoylglutathione lyase family enzyme
MARVDHVAIESNDPGRTAEFYERFLCARIVRTEGHPVMAYVQSGAIAIHEPSGPGPHIAFRVSDDERAALKRELEKAGVEAEERDTRSPSACSSATRTAVCSRRSPTVASAIRDGLRPDEPVRRSSHLNRRGPGGLRARA